MFEEFIVGDLHALNLVDYLTTTDFVHGGGGWWYGDLSIPAEYRNSEKFYMWYHFYMESTSASGLRVGFIPTPATYARTIRTTHAANASPGTWIGGETYEPVFMGYEGSAASQMMGGEVIILKGNSSWGRCHLISYQHAYNGTTGYTKQDTSSGDLSGITWETTTGLRLSSGGLPTTGTPIIGRAELYALSPRSLL